VDGHLLAAGQFDIGQKALVAAQQARLFQFGENASALPAPQATGDALHRLFQARQALGVGETHMVAGLVATEVQARREGQVLGFEEVPAEGEGIAAEGTDIGIQVERALRLDGNAEAQFAQGRQQVVATAGELGAALFENRQCLGSKQASAACWAMLGALM
jgi:hypothetical protein